MCALDGGDSSNEDEKTECQEAPEDVEAVPESNHDEDVADLDQDGVNTPLAPEGDSEEEDGELKVEHPESKSEVKEEEVNYPDTAIDLSHLQSQR